MSVSRREFLKTAGTFVMTGLGVAIPRQTEAAPPQPVTLEDIRNNHQQLVELAWPNQPFKTVVLPVSFPDLGLTETTVHNRIPMIPASGDTFYQALATRAKAYGESQSWGDVLAKTREWFYPLLIADGTYKLEPETWAYAEQIVKADGLSVYQKPKVAGQLWARLPAGVTDGELTVAFAVNNNFVKDKTGGDPNVVPAVIVRGNAGAPIEVVYTDKNLKNKKGVDGRLEPETGNIIVQLNPDGLTVVRFPVWSPQGRRTEVMIEPGSDNLTNEEFNRATPAMAKPF